MKRQLALPLLFGALTMFVASCGAKVVIDPPAGNGEGGDGGVGGAGGAGGVGGGSGGSGLSTSNSSVASSSSSGQPSPCDGTANCAGCIKCTSEFVCVNEWTECAAVPVCLELGNCLSGCQSEQNCIQKCLAVYSSGIDLYTKAAQCAVCTGCPMDCKDLTTNCP